jgi:acyl-homoserine-lactone acylase
LRYHSLQSILHEYGKKGLADPPTQPGKSEHPPVFGNQGTIDLWTIVPFKEQPVKRSRLVLVGVLVLIMLLAPVLSIAHGQSNKTEILWDTWGVPHIFAADNRSLFYAFGWAQAHNHANLILKLYGEARGRAAEYWGPDSLESDKLVRTLGVTQQAQAEYEKLPQDFKDYADAFASGINDYAQANPDAIDSKWKIVLPVKATDILGYGIRSLRYTFLAGTGIAVAKNWKQTDIGGSSAWAIGPSRSASGKAMLLANPHQPWSGLGMWVEAHLISPDVNVYGAALVGSPVLSIAFNQYLGWTHTVNTHDGWDLYELTLTADGTSYLFDGKEQPFDMHTETIRVIQPDVTYTETKIVVRRSVHGPVIAERRERSALALRVVADNVSDATIEWWEMGKAHNLQEFEAALKPLRIPMFTIIYADRDGNILHVFNEQAPIRSEGDWSFWNNTTVIDRSHPAIIPGDTSKYLWPFKYHPYEDLPRVLNPASGWLQNANEPPWTTTYPLALDPAKYPAYMAPKPFVWPRPQASIRLLYEHPSISFDQMIEYKHSTFAELTNQLLDNLIAAARASKLENAKKAAEILAKWDRHADADSVGAALFTAWSLGYVQATGPSVFAKPWDIDDPLNTPRGLADPDAAVEALDKVATQLEALRLVGGGMDVPYGKAFRLRVGKYDLPANGGFDVLGTFRTLTFAQDKDLRFKAVQGDSYVAAVEFTQPVRAKVLLSHGNATQPNSPHVGDQLELFTQKKLRDAWLTRQDIEAHLEERTVV